VCRAVGFARVSSVRVTRVGSVGVSCFAQKSLSCLVCNDCLWDNRVGFSGVECERYLRVGRQR